MDNKILEVIEEIIKSAPEKILEEDIIYMRRSGQSADYSVGKNAGIDQFLENINKIKEKYANSNNSMDNL